MKCPVNLKLNNLNQVNQIDHNISGKASQRNLIKSSDGKQILRNVMKNYVPKSIVSAEKQGFSSPDSAGLKGKALIL